VVLCAGNSTRFSLTAKKQWIRLGDEPLWLSVTKRLSSYGDFKDIIVVSHINELNYMKNFADDFTFVAGGDTRQASMSNALQNVTTPYVMITDVARCCVPKNVIHNLLENKSKADCIVPYLKVSDTVVYENETINRDDVKLIQTPQLSNTNKLKSALENAEVFTDDSSAIKNIAGSVYYVEGSTKSTKLTFGDEFKMIDCLSAPSSDTFVGTGIDIHPFEDGKDMYLGGVKIQSEFGFKAHSDGDVLIHSVIDAMLGAIGAGDIGEFFPDTDPKYKGADSKVLLADIVSFIANVGYEIKNVDLTILAEVPKINPHKENIKTSLAKLLNLPKNKINIKATTAEKLGFIGRKEAVAVQSVATLKYFDWTKEK
jgi:2-C-methyl-D-erythritol 4-phosphate cytidylyltransferase/2-C-methyl-D-erythritol 2,4-cyclodiphosphate synthase